MIKNDQIEKKIISFSEAFQFLKKFRYKPRSQWTKEEKKFFKICNFIILSKKRINKVFVAINSFCKLSDKSHYSYKKEDIRIIKDMILKHIEEGLKRFDKNIKTLKEEDIIKLKEYFESLKEQNLSLQNENQRLQSLIRNHITEKKLNETNALEDILKRNQKVIMKKKTKNKNFNEKKLKEFIDNWDQGLTAIDLEKEVNST